MMEMGPLPALGPHPFTWSQRKPLGTGAPVEITGPALNHATVPDRYPIPHLQDFASTVQGATVFSHIDLVRAYNQIPVAARKTFQRQQ